MKTLGKEIPIVLRYDFFDTLHYDLSFRRKAYRANGGVSTTMVARVKLLSIGPNSLNLSLCWLALSYKRLWNSQISYFKTDISIAMLTGITIPNPIYHKFT